MQDLPKRHALPFMRPGVYRLKYDLTLRSTPGLETTLVTGKYHAQSHQKAGSIVFVNKVTYLSHSIWGNTACGCICLYMNSQYLAEPI